MGGLVCELAVTRTVRDTAAVLDAVAGPAPGDPYAAPTPARPFLDELAIDPGRLRIGMQSAAFGQGSVTHPDCVAATEAAGALLESIGHVVEPTRVTALDDPTFIETFLVFWSAGIAHDVDHYWSGKLGRALGRDDVEPLTWALVEAGRAASSSDYLAARHKLQEISRGVAQWYETGFDILLTPTLAQPPPLIGEFDSPADNPLHGLLRAAELVPFTPPFNVVGTARRLPAPALERPRTAHRRPTGGALRARRRPSPGGGPARRGCPLGPSPASGERLAVHQ